MSKLLILNAAELVTVSGPKDPKTGGISGPAMNDLKILKNASVLCRDGLIEKIIKEDEELNLQALLDDGYELINATGKVVTPGFVDSHTHLVFGGDRADEYDWRLKGQSYMEIMEKGGGIVSSVKQTRVATEDQLYQSAKKRLESMLRFGVTTAEAKSGYGLDYETEMKQLKVVKRLQQDQPVEIASTFMGPHALPAERKDDRAGFLKDMEDMLKDVKAENLAEFADIFCEDKVFSIEESRHFLEAAKKHGFKVKIHADEIVNLGGAGLAAEVGAVSADHLLNASDEGLLKMKEAGTVATLLPMTAFSLKEEYARARFMIDSGLTLAVATDYNPGSCFSESIPLLIALSTNKMGMSIEETITALTINGAAALGRQEKIGSIEAGKQADLLVHEFANYKFIVYHIGVSTVETVIKKGCIIC